jgi:leucyl-tRNA synthetase
VQNTAWPDFDESLLQNDTQKLVVQVNGKRRGELVVAQDIDQESAVELARADKVISSHLEGKNVRRVIFVPGRILNIVVA